MSAPFVVAIFGPTGVGKTGVATQLAEMLAGHGAQSVIVNCDSIQVYSGLETISGAPTDEDRSRVDHRLTGHIELDEAYSSAIYAEEAHREIDAILDEGAWPLVVGGTGLYLRAAVSDLDMLPEVPGEVREALEEQWDSEGGGALHARLPSRYRERVHENDRKRVLRFLGLLEIGVEPHPDSASGGTLWSADLRHPTLMIGIVEDRAVLEEAIRDRVAGMAAAGAADEAQRALAKGMSETARKAIGFDGFLEDDLEAVTRAHLSFARRQMTWMRRMEGVTVVERGGRSDQDVAEQILRLVEAGPGLNAPVAPPG